MSTHGPEEHCYWRERYLELQENMAYSFEGFAQTLEAQNATPVNQDLQRELDAARADLAKLKGSRLVRAQSLFWRGARKARRSLNNLRNRR